MSKLSCLPQTPFAHLPRILRLGLRTKVSFPNRIRRLLAHPSPQGSMLGGRPNACVRADVVPFFTRPTEAPGKLPTLTLGGGGCAKSLRIGFENGTLFRKHRTPGRAVSRPAKGPANQTGRQARNSRARKRASKRASTRASKRTSNRTL